MEALPLMDATLARARAGDEEAFRELTDPHRRELRLLPRNRELRV